MKRRDFLGKSAAALGLAGLESLRGVGHAQGTPSPGFLVGVNYPWAAYGHDFGKNEWGHDGLSASGWTYQTYVNSQGFTDARPCTEKAYAGWASLCITADLAGQDTHRSQGEVFLDLTNHPPLGVQVPLNLRNVAVRCQVCLPRGSSGWDRAPNGVQLFFKSRRGEQWDSFYSSWQNIQSTWEEKWVPLTASPSGQAGYKDPGFDPSRVVALGNYSRSRLRLASRSRM